MHIIAKKRLREFWEEHLDAKGQLEAWCHEVKHSTWSKSADVKAMYPKASVVTGNRVVFDICHNKYRLIVLIKYKFSTVYVRFVGTHKEYDTVNAKEI
jgi:mRNA interferase HigB